MLRLNDLSLKTWQGSDQQPRQGNQQDSTNKQWEMLPSGNVDIQEAIIFRLPDLYRTATPASELVDTRYRNSRHSSKTEDPDLA